MVTCCVCNSEPFPTQIICITFNPFSPIVWVLHDLPNNTWTLKHCATLHPLQLFHTFHIWIMTYQITPTLKYCACHVCDNPFPSITFSSTSIYTSHRFSLLIPSFFVLPLVCLCAYSLLHVSFLIPIYPFFLLSSYLITLFCT